MPESPQPTNGQDCPRQSVGVVSGSGVMQPKDSVDLHNLPLVITVRLKKRDDNGDLSNEIKGYAAKKSSIAQSPQAPQTNATPPWRR